METDPTRGRYERVLEVMQATGAGDFLVYPKLLRLENALNPARQNYTFNLYEDAPNFRASEIRLNRNDAFVCNAIGLALYKPSAEGEEGQAPLFTWPNTEVFATAGEAEALNQLYNGTLTIRTGPVDRLKDFHTSLLKYNPNDRLIAATATATGGPIWGATNAQRGLYEWEPGIIFDGSDDNKVFLNAGPGDFSDSVPDGETNIVVVHMLGYLIEGGKGYLGRWYIK